MSKENKPRIVVIDDNGERQTMNSATVIKKAQAGWTFNDFSDRLHISSSERILEILRNNEIPSKEIDRIIRNSERILSKKTESGQMPVIEQVREPVEVTTVEKEATVIPEEDHMAVSEKAEEIVQMDVEKRKTELEAKIASYEEELQALLGSINNLEMQKAELRAECKTHRNRLLELEQETKREKAALETAVNQLKQFERQAVELRQKEQSVSLQKNNAEIELEAYRKIPVFLVEGKFSAEEYAPEEAYVLTKRNSLLEKEKYQYFTVIAMKHLATLICGIENIICSGMQYELVREEIPEEIWEPLQEELKELS